MSTKGSVEGRMRGHMTSRAPKSVGRRDYELGRVVAGDILNIAIQDDKRKKNEVFH